VTVTSVLSSANTRQVEITRDASLGLVVSLKGRWRIGRGLPSVEGITDRLKDDSRPEKIVFDTTGLESWDTSLLAFVVRLIGICRQHGIRVETEGLPQGLKRLLELVESDEDRSAPNEETVSKKTEFHPSLLERVGLRALGFYATWTSLLEFIGQVSIAFAKLLLGKARMRFSDLVVQVYGCSARALGIVSLISFLVGTILAFMGAVQLQQFGATIYVADLVGIGIARDMGAMMTAIIMAGRTGAAYAAELGTMRVAEEIDALQTMGIAPIEFLVLPRFIALVVMMPLLCLYADFLGMVGGASVAAGVLGISFRAYFHRTAAAVTLGSMLGGLVKATVYGVLIALAGCWRGFQGEASSAAVGSATTAAVVDAIVWIVVACGMFAFIFRILNI